MAKTTEKPVVEQSAADLLLTFRDTVYTSRTLIIPGTGRTLAVAKGQILPGFKGGLKQLDTLRTIGGRLQPLTLTTGYGDVLGTWCLTNVDEDQSALMQGGIPRKQEFTLEFVRYGDDMQNV